MLRLTSSIPASGKVVIGPLPLGAVVESVRWWSGNVGASRALVGVSFHRQRPELTDSAFASGDQAFDGTANAMGRVVSLPIALVGPGTTAYASHELFLHRVVEDESRYLAIGEDLTPAGSDGTSGVSVKLSSGVTAGTGDAPKPSKRTAEKVSTASAAEHRGLLAAAPVLSGESGVGSVDDRSPRPRKKLERVPDHRAF